MIRDWSRRDFLTAILAGVGAGAMPWAARAGDAELAPGSLAGIEARVGGRLGVYSLDTGSGRTLSHRAGERFAMCSTFKWVLAAAVLARADHAGWAMDDVIPYSERDLLAYAPVTRGHVAEGGLPLESLLRAAVTISDNTAANLLLETIGGPEAWTRFVRSLGDRVSRLDRYEPELNSNVNGDPRDTTSPRAMVGLMRRVLCGDALPTGHRDRLLGWMRDCKTGRNRLRAGLPPDWDAGDKSGTGAHGAANDVAIAWPPGRAPVLIACYLSNGDGDASKQAAAHAGVGRMVANRRHSKSRTP